MYICIRWCTLTRESTIPEDILKYVPCRCCRVRNDSVGVYRVYKYSAIKLPSGKWSSDYGYLIGKILSDKGFIPNKRYLKERGEQGTVIFSDGITDVTYGQYALLHHLSNDILENWKLVFRVKELHKYTVTYLSFARTVSFTSTRLMTFIRKVFCLLCPAATLLKWGIQPSQTFSIIWG